MEMTTQQAENIAATHYGICGHARKLPGELDSNFYLETTEGEKFILKIANEKEQRQNLDLQNEAIKHLSSKSNLTTSKVCRSVSGEEILYLTIEGSGLRFVRLLTWIEGRVFASVNPQSPLLLQRLGEMCGKLSSGLTGFDHPAAHRFMKWDPAQAAWAYVHLSKFSGERKEIMTHFYRLFETVAVPAFPHLRKSVNYNDANDYNVLVSNDVNDPHVPGVIDFGDLVYTHTINEVAIAIAYAAMNKPNPLEAAGHIVKGYHSQFSLTDEELKVLYTLVAIRLLISVVCAELNRLEHPENSYLQISDRPAWDLLAKWKTISPAFAYYTFRNACNMEPCPSLVTASKAGVT